MSEWVNKILKYNYGIKLLKAPFAMFTRCSFDKKKQN